MSAQKVWYLPDDWQTSKSKVYHLDHDCLWAARVMKPGTLAWYGIVPKYGNGLIVKGRRPCKQCAS